MCFSPSWWLFQGQWWSCTLTHGCLCHGPLCPWSYEPSQGFWAPLEESMCFAECCFLSWDFRDPLGWSSSTLCNTEIVQPLEPFLRLCLGLRDCGVNMVFTISLEMAVFPCGWPWAKCLLCLCGMWTCIFYCLITTILFTKTVSELHFCLSVSFLRVLLWTKRLQFISSISLQWFDHDTW